MVRFRSFQWSVILKWCYSCSYSGKNNCLKPAITNSYQGAMVICEMHLVRVVPGRGSVDDPLASPRWGIEEQYLTDWNHVSVGGRERKRGRARASEQKGISAVEESSVYFYPGWWERLLWHSRWAPLSCRFLCACRATPSIHAGVTHILRASLTYIWENTHTHSNTPCRVLVETGSAWQKENKGIKGRMCGHFAWIH